MVLTGTVVDLDQPNRSRINPRDFFELLTSHR